jgi:hypothetical protein
VKATGLGLGVLGVGVRRDARCWMLVESVMASGSSGRWAWFMGRGRLLLTKNPSTLDIGIGTSFAPFCRDPCFAYSVLTVLTLTVLTVQPGAIVTVVVTLVETQQPPPPCLAARWA